MIFTLVLVLISLVVVTISLQSQLQAVPKLNATTSTTAANSSVKRTPTPTKTEIPVEGDRPVYPQGEISAPSNCPTGNITVSLIGAQVVHSYVELLDVDLTWNVRNDTSETVEVFASQPMDAALLKPDNTQFFGVSNFYAGGSYRLTPATEITFKGRTPYTFKRSEWQQSSAIVIESSHPSYSPLWDFSATYPGVPKCVPNAVVGNPGVALPAEN